VGAPAQGPGLSNHVTAQPNDPNLVTLGIPFPRGIAAAFLDPLHTYLMPARLASYFYPTYPLLSIFSYSEALRCILQRCGVQRNGCDMLLLGPSTLHYLL
jgi:hypothetical protein